jgi:hypothetical protein
VLNIEVLLTVDALITPALVDVWQYDAAGTLFTERSSPSTPTTNGGVVGTWRGRVNSTDLPAESDAKRPIYNSSRGVQFFWKTDGGTVNAKMILSGLSATNRNNFSGGIVVEWPGTAVTGIDFDSASEFAPMPGNGATSHLVHYFNGAAFVSTGKNGSCRRCTISWRGNGTDFRIWVNGSLYTGTALSSATLDSIVLGSFTGGLSNAVTVKELVLYSAATSDGEAANLNTYLRNRAGTLGDGNLVALLGDSLTVAVGSETGRPWHDRCAERPLS